MVGVELVTDRKEKTPAKAETLVLFENLRGMQLHPGVLLDRYRAKLKFDSVKISKFELDQTFFFFLFQIFKTRFKK